MTYSENLTNRELLYKAMPFTSLSRKQWNVILRLLKEVEEQKGSETVLFKALETLHNNQARLEVMGNYLCYFSDSVDNPVREKKLVINAF